MATARAPQLRVMILRPTWTMAIVSITANQKGSFLGALQAQVGGMLEFIHHTHMDRARFVAYVNENGFNGGDIEPNVFAFAVLRRLGFRPASMLPGIVMGNAVVCGHGSDGNERSLTDEEVAMIQEAADRFVHLTSEDSSDAYSDEEGDDISSDHDYDADGELEDEENKMEEEEVIDLIKVD